MNRGYLQDLKRSLTAQISLSIVVVSILLVGGSGLSINWLAERELREGNELILFANLALLRDDLATSGFDLQREPMRLVKRMDLQLGQLHMAMFDDHRRLIAASEHFEVPVKALPNDPIPFDTIPMSIDQADLRTLGKTIGPLTSLWRSPEHRTYRVLLASIPIPPQDVADHGAGSRQVLVAFSYELTETRQLLAHELQVFLITLLIGALSALVIGIGIARRIVAGPMRLAAAANRISVRPLSERLSLESTPTELVESTLAFNRMLDRLEASFRRLSEFSSDLAHDLRTPIHNLLGEAQVALSKPRSADEYREVIESAIEDYERISRLIENMLFLTRADDPHTATHRRWIDLQALIGRGCGYFEMLAEELGVVLKIDTTGTASSGQRAWADDTLFLRAFSNLVANALRYTPRGSAILISTAGHPGGACTVDVCNDGPVIAPEHQARIFERSYRIDGSRAGSASGSGLGLAIVKSIMDLHGGTAGVVSGNASPTVFRLWFPGPTDTATAVGKV